MRTLCTFPILASLLVTSLVYAEPKPSQPLPGPAAKPVACTWSGTAQPTLGLALLSSNGQAIARFGGAPVALTVTEVPELATGKLHVTTGGSARVKFDGYVEARGFPLFLKSDVTVASRTATSGQSSPSARAAGSVMLRKGSQVEFAGASREEVRVIFRAQPPLGETFNVTLPCSGVALESTVAEASPPLGHARGYFMTSPEAPLFDSPGAQATVVTTLHLAPDSRGILFYGDRREGNFIHVSYRKDVKIDGWMSVKDLTLLPKGELVDQRSQKPAPGESSKLSVGSEARIYRTLRAISLYGKADPKQAPIGLVPADTELYVLDVVVGWVNVLPKQLDVVPLSEKRFWVRASELGI